MDQTKAQERYFQEADRETSRFDPSISTVDASDLMDDPAKAFEEEWEASLAMKYHVHPPYRVLIANQSLHASFNRLWSIASTNSTRGDRRSIDCRPAALARNVKPYLLQAKPSALSSYRLTSMRKRSRSRIKLVSIAGGGEIRTHVRSSNGKEKPRRLSRRIERRTIPSRNVTIEISVL